jgi:hypothetical protein
MAASTTVDQRHDWRGIEEMEADDPLRAVPGRRCDRPNRQRARVRGQDRVSRDHPVKAGKQRLLDVELLNHGLDHQRGSGRLVRVGPKTETLEDRTTGQVEGRAGQSTSEEPAAQPVLDPGAGLLGGGRVDIDQADRMAMLQRQLGDPGAHRSGAKDRDLDWHPFSRP